VLVLKSSETWKFDISHCHSLITGQNPAKTVYLKTCSKCPPPAFTQAQSLLIKLSTALLMEFCGRSSHIVWKTFFSSSVVFGLGWILKCLVVFKHAPKTWLLRRLWSWWVRHNYSGVTKTFPCEKL